MRKIVKNLKTLIIVAACVALNFSCSSGPRAKQDNNSVFVSILPQAYFVQSIASDRVQVEVMVGPGQSPATYEPTPKQMARLGQAKLYFSVDVPFERIWLDKIKQTNPQMKVVDTADGIPRLTMQDHLHDHEPLHNDHDVAEQLKDPHIWLSPRLAKIQARSICDALKSTDPDYADHYEQGLVQFHDELDRLDTRIRERLIHLKSRKFLVFHPSWGYFAREYGMQQIPIEIEGKKPSARELTQIIELARKHEIKVIFVQQQFSKSQAETVAGAIDGRVLSIDPLAGDYMANLELVAQTLAEVMK